MQPIQPRRIAAERIDSGGLLLWVDGGEPRSMAAAMGSTPNGDRIGYVYTPPELRGHGYASAITAALTRRILESGRRFCFLYTDVANATANAIYPRLGYRAVGEVVDLVFEAGQA